MTELPSSHSRNARGIRAAAAALAVMVAVSSAACASSSPPRVEDATPITSASDDRVEIYDLVVRRDCTDYFRDGKLPQTLYIVRSEAVVVDGMPAPSPEEMTIPAGVQEGVLHALADFGPEVEWIDAAADVRGPMATGGTVDGGRGAIVELGSIARSSATKATVYASIYAGNVGASGRTYTLERVNGIWAITGTTGVEWTS